MPFTEEIHNLSGIEILPRTDAVPPLSPETQLAFFRAAQEILNDVHLRCGAPQPGIIMECLEAKVRVPLVMMAVVRSDCLVLSVLCQAKVITEWLLNQAFSAIRNQSLNQMARIRQGGKLEAKTVLILRFLNGAPANKEDKENGNKRLFYDHCEGGLLPKSLPRCAKILEGG